MQHASVIIAISWEIQSQSLHALRDGNGLDKAHLLIAPLMYKRQFRSHFSDITTAVTAIFTILLSLLSVDSITPSN